MNAIRFLHFTGTSRVNLYSPFTRQLQRFLEDDINKIKFRDYRVILSQTYDDRPFAIKSLSLKRKTENDALPDGSSSRIGDA